VSNFLNIMHYQNIYYSLKTYKYYATKLIHQKLSYLVIFFVQMGDVICLNSFNNYKYTFINLISNYKYTQIVTVITLLLCLKINYNNEYFQFHFVILLVIYKLNNFFN